MSKTQHNTDELRERLSEHIDDLIDESMEYERGNWTGHVRSTEEREQDMLQVSAWKQQVLDDIEALLGGN